MTLPVLQAFIGIRGLMLLTGLREKDLMLHSITIGGITPLNCSTIIVVY